MSKLLLRTFRAHVSKLSRATSLNRFSQITPMLTMSCTTKVSPQSSFDLSQSLTTQAYVVNEQGGELCYQDISLPPLKATQVQLDMQYCGLCHTDIHMRDNDWGISDYPLVLGHEGIGVVSHIGDSVRDIQIGDTVGVGWMRDSCQTCSQCLSGRENLCDKGYQGTYLSAHAGCWGKEAYNEIGGCFSKIMRIEERFAVKIPDEIPPTVAAPLMCAGGTVFEPICNYVAPGVKVAICSIGGLGSEAIKLAAAYGGDVTALSRSDGKKQVALQLGATRFAACLGNADKMKEFDSAFDVIIDTCPINQDVSPYIAMLKFGGTYCRVGIPAADNQTFSFDYIPLIFTQKRIAGSIVTGTLRMKQLFQIASSHLKEFNNDPNDWDIEVVPFDKVNETMDDLVNQRNKNSFRYVLQW